MTETIKTKLSLKKKGQTEPTNAQKIAEQNNEHVNSNNIELNDNDFENDFDETLDNNHDNQVNHDNQDNQDNQVDVDESQLGDLHEGCVKWFDDAKGFGFISDLDNNEEIFVHHTNINPMVSEYRTLKKGEYVSFFIGEADPLYDNNGNEIECRHKNQAIRVMGIKRRELMCDTNSFKSSPPKGRRSNFKGGSNRHYQSPDLDNEDDVFSNSTNKRFKNKSRGPRNNHSKNYNRNQNNDEDGTGDDEDWQPIGKGGKPLRN